MAQPQPATTDQPLVAPVSQPGESDNLGQLVPVAAGDTVLDLSQELEDLSVNPLPNTEQTASLMA